MQEKHDKLLLKALIAQWSELKTLHELLSSTDDEKLLLAIFAEYERRFCDKGKST